MNSLARRRPLLFASLFLGLVVIAGRVPVDCADPRLNSKESLLRQDLFALRQAIDQYTLDKQQPPGSLEDLVKAGYLKSIPSDPYSGRRDWVIDKEPEMLDPRLPGIPPDIVDVHSATLTKAGDGSPYGSW
jgi:general secretion pathway protein G